MLFKRGRRELGPETNSDHLPWRIWTTSWENSAHNPGEFGSTFGEFGLLFELNNFYIQFEINSNGFIWRNAGSECFLAYLINPGNRRRGDSHGGS